MMPVSLASLVNRLEDRRPKTPAVAGQAEVASILKFNISYFDFATFLVEKRKYIKEYYENLKKKLFE